MKKLLMLGTSLASVEIVETAQRMGAYTIVTDNLSPEYSEAKNIADEYWMLSTDDLDAIEEKCRAEGVNAIFAGISEFNLDRVKELTERLGLPCYIENGPWKYARDKSAFKDKCREIGIPVPEEYNLSDPPQPKEISGIEYPVVVKPVDGTGNKGLSICNNKEELIAGCAKARSNADSGEILVERYVSGEETWNHYFIAENEIRNAYRMRAYKQPGYPSFLYSFGSSALQDDDEYKEQLNEKCVRFLREIGCKKGVAWFQFIRDDKGRYYAIEMAQRMSADTSGMSVEKVTGVNSMEWMLDIAFGGEHTADMLPAEARPPFKQSHCVYLHFADRAGTVSSIEGYDKLDKDKFRISMLVHEGEKVPGYRLMCMIIFNAGSAEEMCDVLRQINADTRILDENGENMYLKYEDYGSVIQKQEGLFRGE